MMAESTESGDVQVQVEVETQEQEPVYVATAEPVEGEAEPVEPEPGLGGAKEAMAPLKAMKNPMDAMDGWTLLVGFLVSSIIVAVAACIEGVNFGSSLAWWAFAGSLLSVIIIAILMILKKFAPAAYNSAAQWILIFLLVWWVAIVFPATFYSPFPTLGNGWLGCWISLVFAAVLAARAFADKAKALNAAIKSQSSTGATKNALFLGAGSIVFLIAACFTISNTVAVGIVVTTVTDRSYAAYAVSIAVISIVACALVMVWANVESLKASAGTVNIVVSIFLIVWWVIGAFVVTFVAPYKDAGPSTNGWLAVWVCLYFATGLFKACGLDTVRKLVTKNGGNGEAAEGGDAQAESGKQEEGTPAL